MTLSRRHLVVQAALILLVVYIAPYDINGQWIGTALVVLGLQVGLAAWVVGQSGEQRGGFKLASTLWTAAAVVAGLGMILVIRGG